MQTIGERLEEARKRKGISIREAAENTKIRGDYLQKFEANTFDIDLPALYIRGFLRSYSRYLELDPARIVNDFNVLLADRKPARRETREVYGRVDFTEASRSKESGEPAPANRAAQDQALVLKYGLLGGGAIVLVVIIILLFKVIFSGASPKAPAATQTPVQAAAATQPDAAQTLTLTATDSTRVKVVQDSDGVVLFNASLGRGESKNFKKQGKLLITIESGKNLRLEVNGRNYMIPFDGYGRFALD